MPLHNRILIGLVMGAAVGGGIPILRALREGFTGDRIRSVHGIINGTANYILTRMHDAPGTAFADVVSGDSSLAFATISLVLLPGSTHRFVHEHCRFRAI